MKALPLALFLTACSGAGHIPPEENNIQRISVVPQSFDTTWNMVVEWFVLRGTPVDRMSKVDGVITSEANLRADHELDCGQASGRISWATAKLENIRGQINVVVREVGPDESKVLVSVFGKAQSNVRNAYGNVISSEAANCVSSGALEAELFEYLELGIPE